MIQGCQDVHSNKSFSHCSLENLEDEEDDEITPGVGLVHQAVLDNNPEKLEKLIEVTLDETIVTTPTQPQLNSKVGFDTKMTLDHHHHPPPHKLNVINISAVPDPILTKL